MLKWLLLIDCRKKKNRWNRVIYGLLPTDDWYIVGVRRWEPSPVNDIISASYKNNLCLVHRAVLSFFEVVWMYLVSLKTTMKIQNIKIEKIKSMQNISNCTLICFFINDKRLQLLNKSTISRAGNSHYKEHIFETNLWNLSRRVRIVNEFWTRRDSRFHLSTQNIQRK